MDSSWKIEKNRLSRCLHFEDFKTALKYVNLVGELAETREHHPDIYLENYNKVTLVLTTHDEEGKVTEKDISFARAVDRLIAIGS